MHIPSPTSDLDRVGEDLATSGFAILRDALAADELSRARTRLAAIARHERESGRAILEDGSAANGSYRPGANQRVTSLVAKDALFAAIATNPSLLSAARTLFANSYAYPEAIVRQYGFDRAMLASMTANIANPGGRAMDLHFDQGFAPPATPFPILLNAVLPLVDFTTGNGATRVAPGSHLADPTELHAGVPDARPVEAAAGSALLIDGRTWHGTGRNRTDHPRPAILLTYCAPWVRPFANHGLDVDERLLATASPELLELLGYEPWLVFGASEARRLDLTRRALGDRADSPA